MTTTSTGMSTSGFHRLEDLMVCPRRFGYRQVLNLVPGKMNEFLALGTAGHEALAAYYEGRDWHEVLHLAPPRWAYKAPKAKEIVEQYVCRPGAGTDPVLVNGVATEKELAVTVRGLLLTRRVDRLFRWRDGKVWGADHKFTGQPRKRIKVALSDGSLFTQHIVGKAHYGNEWGGVVLNCLGTSRSSEGKYEFIREAVAFSPVLMAEAMDSLWHWLRLAQWYIDESGMSPWKYPQTWRCHGRYPMSMNYMCEYWDLCRMGRKAAENRYEREER